MRYLYSARDLEFWMEMVGYPSMVSQLAIKIIENPKMETNRKFRRSSCVLPILHIDATSAVVPRFRWYRKHHCIDFSLPEGCLVRLISLKDQT